MGGRLHTTVMHSCDKIAKELISDDQLLRDINTLKEEMGAI